MERIVELLYRGLIACGTYAQPVILLAIRLIWGWLFYVSGTDKLDDIDPVITYFKELGIPYPVFNAYFVSLLEFIGGSCLLVGFASRLCGLALTLSMGVAIATAHHASLKVFFVNPADLIHQDPFTFFFAALLIFAFGPGLLSVDALIKRRYS